MITIDRVTPKKTTTGKTYVLIEASGRTVSSWDPTWTNCVGREVPTSYLSKDKKGYWNLPDVSVVFAVDPRATVPVVPQAPNGLQARQTQEERYEILSRQVAEILAILKAHFRA